MIGEAFHSPLRRVYNKVSANHPVVDRELPLRLVVKACNDTRGPDGLDPSLLVLSTLSTLAIVSRNNPAQAKSMEAMQTASEEMESFAP